MHTLHNILTLGDCKLYCAQYTQFIINHLLLFFSSTVVIETTSPLTSHQQTTTKPRRFDNKLTTPKSLNDTKKLKMTTDPKYSSPVSDIADIDWGDDDLLSQVDISALCEQEVETSTQRSDLESSLKENRTTCNNDDSLVTESWDFDDDSDELIQTLEQVEQSQRVNVNKVPDKMTTRHNTVKELYNIEDDSDELIQTLEQFERMQSVLVGKVTDVKSTKQNITLKEQSKKQGQSNTNQPKSMCSKEDIERKRLEAQQKRKSRLKLAKNNRPNTRQNTFR